MGIKIPICQSIKHKYTYNKKYTYINKPVFVILSSLMMYAKLGSISGCRPSALVLHSSLVHSFWGWPMSVLILVAIRSV